MEDNPTMSTTLAAAKDYIRFNFLPVDEYKEATLRITTQELFDKLVSMFPDEEFSPILLFDWLNEFGFIYMDSGNLRLEWLLKKKS